MASRSTKIAALLANGLSPAKVASKLHISVTHVDRHIAKEAKKQAEPVKPRCLECDTVLSFGVCSECARKTVKAFEQRYERTPQPTKAKPGTLEKVEVFRRRVESGECLFHDDDATDFSGMIGGVRGSVGYPGSGMGRREIDVPTRVMAGNRVYRK